MSEIPAVVVAQRDGTVVAQNASARRLMGPADGRACWNVVGALKDTDGLPCAFGCVRELLASGLERARHTRIALGGRRHLLTCVPLRGVAVCMLTPGTGRRPETWQLLTFREKEVLQLLADGETTATMAIRLDLSESTVRTHVENMRIKLGVPTRAALVALGFRLGFLD
jgi:DNA-binding CsgD family transcriptional regulator